MWRSPAQCSRLAWCSSSQAPEKLPSHRNRLNGWRASHRHIETMRVGSLLVRFLLALDLRVFQFFPVFSRWAEELHLRYRVGNIVLAALVLAFSGIAHE